MYDALEQQGDEGERQIGFPPPQQRRQERRVPPQQDPEEESEDGEGENPEPMPAPLPEQYLDTAEAGCPSELALENRLEEYLARRLALLPRTKENLQAVARLARIQLMAWDPNCIFQIGHRLGELVLTMWDKVAPTTDYLLSRENFRDAELEEFNEALEGRYAGFPLSWMHRGVRRIWWERHTMFGWLASVFLPVYAVMAAALLIWLQMPALPSTDLLVFPGAYAAQLRPYNTTLIVPGQPLPDVWKCNPLMDPSYSDPTACPKWALKQVVSKRWVIEIHLDPNEWLEFAFDFVWMFPQHLRYWLAQLYMWVNYLSAELMVKILEPLETWGRLAVKWWTGMPFDRVSKHRLVWRAFLTYWAVAIYTAFVSALIVLIVACLVTINILNWLTFGLFGWVCAWLLYFYQLGNMFYLASFLWCRLAAGDFGTQGYRNCVTLTEFAPVQSLWGWVISPTLESVAHYQVLYQNEIREFQMWASAWLASFQNGTWNWPGAEPPHPTAVLAI